HKAFLARIVDEGPIPAIHGVVRWRACDLIMRLYEEFGLSVSGDTIYRALKKLGFSHMSARPNPTFADFLRARDFRITFSVTHGWSAFWRGRPWLAGRRIGETSSDVGSSRFWIGCVTKHGDKCARSTWC